MLRPRGTDSPIPIRCAALSRISGTLGRLVCEQLGEVIIALERLARGKSDVVRASPGLDIRCEGRTKEEGPPARQKE